MIEFQIFRNKFGSLECCNCDYEDTEGEEKKKLEEEKKRKEEEEKKRKEDEEKIKYPGKTQRNFRR